MSALSAIVVLVVIFALAKGTQFLMPGPLASAHGTIGACSTCHSHSGSGKLSWVRGLVADDRLADSKACVSCHKMPETAFEPHGASADALRQSTMRLTKVAIETHVPRSVRAQSIAFPAETAISGGLACATCHQEHKGKHIDLKKISNEKCQSCHVVKFDSFDGHHPEFRSYPFRRRTRIIFDHVGHFGKHFPETIQKTPATSIPSNCSTCHSSGSDRRIMEVAPFEQTCGACHLDQITGKERVSGPKGIAFLSLPGLDLPALKKRKHNIGDWPDTSEAPLTPFMKVLIARSDKGRDLLGKINGLRLQELADASNEQIRAVVDLAWEIKGLFYTLIKGQASEVLAELQFAGAKPTAEMIAELTARLPRDVIVGAQLQWLPNLGSEMASRSEAQRGGIVTQAKAAEPVDAKAARGGRSSQPASVKSSPGNDDMSAVGQTQDNQQAETASTKPVETKAASLERAPPKAADQTDDLLFPTEEEQRAMKAGGKGHKTTAQPRQVPSKSTVPTNANGSAVGEAATKVARNVPTPQARAAPVVGIESDVEAESWAANGGWYRQDNVIYYRPVGHKDKLIFSWLRLTGLLTSQSDTSPAAAMFESLTAKDAQGACTKCHSIDSVAGQGRTVNFTPQTAKDKDGRFTRFAHEPHFSIMDQRGCLTCHALEKTSPYLQSYQSGNQPTFASNFGPVKKDVCQTCHTSGSARQDCLTCHKYHVHGVVSPIMSTRIPLE